MNNQWKEKVDAANQALKDYFYQDHGYPEIIFQAMEYSLFAGGKRLRPVLLFSACEALGGSIEDAAPFAAAIEMIHTYSLIHDDLPAMDNDDYRRGRLTCHKKFGEDLAILAGDGLLSLAMEIMAKTCMEKSLPNYTKAMYYVAYGAGTHGMLRGQAADVINEGKKINPDILEFIHKNKTAAMIQGALKAGAAVANASKEVIEVLSEAGECLGVAFQIQDDILDVEGSQEDLGKPIHSDEKNEKNTYVSMFGLEEAKQKAADLTAQAGKLWDSLGEEFWFLKALTEELMNRKS